MKKEIKAIITQLSVLKGESESLAAKAYGLGLRAGHFIPHMKSGSLTRTKKEYTDYRQAVMAGMPDHYQPFFKLSLEEAEEKGLKDERRAAMMAIGPYMAEMRRSLSWAEGAAGTEGAEGGAGAKKKGPSTRKNDAQRVLGKLEEAKKYLRKCIEAKEPLAPVVEMQVVERELNVILQNANKVLGKVSTPTE